MERPDAAIPAALDAMLTLSDTISQEIRDHQGQLNEMVKRRRGSISDSVKTAIEGIAFDNLSNTFMGELMSSMEEDKEELR
jgi:hypothetical protein